MRKSFSVLINVSAISGAACRRSRFGCPPTALAIGITSSFGTSRRSRSAIGASGPSSPVSRPIRSRRVASSSAGLRSTDSSTRCPSIRASTAVRLMRSTTAPSTPRGEKDISPNSSATAVPSRRSLADMFRRCSPYRNSRSGMEVSSGTSDGRTGSMVCPRAWARAYPSPVEPVAG